MKRHILLITAMLLFCFPAFGEQTVKICIDNGIDVNSCVLIDAINPLPVIQSGSNFKNITTNTDTNVKATPGTFVGITTNTAGTTSTAKIYNDADGVCSSGLIGTVDTTKVGTILFGVNASIGICVTTAGAGAADISILYR